MPKYKPKFPKIVEAEGVDTSPLPREMPISTDESRYNTSKKLLENLLQIIREIQTLT